MRLSRDTLARSQNPAPPGFVPEAHGIGIVHLGLGAFHRAHQAWYTHKALEAAGGDWRIMAVSMRSAEMAQALTAQDGLYHLEQTDADGRKVEAVASIARALSLRHARDEIVAQLAAPQTRIITLTVTEKAYCLAPGNGALDPDHPDIRQDLATPERPVTVPGLIAQALAARRNAGTGGLSVLSCDNLPDNGALTRAVVLDFARAVDPALAGWIEGNVTFPSSMVDRITPAVTEEMLAEVAARTGLSDAAAIRTETFAQWVIEDNFPCGRPAWDRAGALMVDAVAPYERMKLRMLNGAHSLMAYAGHVAGLETVKACMKTPVLRALVARHMGSAAATLHPLEGLSYDSYAGDLLRRFDNPGIVHATYQIAMDGSQKMPQRIFAPAAEARDAGADTASFAFATAAWMRYALGRTEAGARYSLRDPLEAEIAAALAGADTADAVISAINGVPGLVPRALVSDAGWQAQVTAQLAAILDLGVREAAERLLEG